METIFDHNPTREELTNLLGSAIPREEYFAAATNQESEYGELYRLFMLRNDPARAGRFLDLITDPIYRLNVSQVDLVD